MLDVVTVSVTDVCNDALGQIGAERIADIDDGTPNAAWCKVFYDRLRMSLLRMHYWNFAEARAELAMNLAPPAFEFANSFALPPELLRIKEYNGHFIPNAAVDPVYWNRYLGFYKIEGRNLLTNDGQVKIVFVQDVQDPTIWDALFGQVLTTALASRLATSIAKDHKMGAELFSRAYGVLLPSALAVDGQEMVTTPYVSDDLVWGRNLG